MTELITYQQLNRITLLLALIFLTLLFGSQIKRVFVEEVSNGSRGHGRGSDDQSETRPSQSKTTPFPAKTG